MLDKVLNFILDQKKSLIKEDKTNSDDYEDLTLAEALIIKQQNQKNQPMTEGKGIDALFPSVPKGGIV